MTKRIAIADRVAFPLILAMLGGIAAGAGACSSDGTGLGLNPDGRAPDGRSGTGGLAGGKTGGNPGAGGAIGAGGLVNAGGAIGAGGLVTTGGAIGAGGLVNTGGTISTGGLVTTGGTISTGGLVTTGGVATGGIPRDAGADGLVSPPDTGAGGAQTCAQVTTQAACDGRKDCHSVFVDPQTCSCAAIGCCTRFSRCAEGAQAQCAGEALCDSILPHCEGAYVVAFANQCYEGCVQKKDCAPNDAGVRVDASPDTSKRTDALSAANCTLSACAAGEVPVRINQAPALCACEPNPCGTDFPTCDCAAALCEKHNATCLGYAPGAGVLNCGPK